jgi:predicted nucleic acid-binding protein
MAEPLVADASLWLALFLREIEGALWADRLSESSLLAPDLLPYELANGLLVAHKRKRVMMDNHAHALLVGLPGLEVTWISKANWWKEALRMAHQHSITIYDAAYIAVATFSDAVFCSLDKNQILAAKKEGLRLLTPAG